MFKLIVAAVAWLGFAAAPALAADDCKPVLRAALQSHPDRARNPTVAVTIDGHPFTFLVDTGGAQSMLKKSRVAALGLPELPLETGSAKNVSSGLTMDHYVRVSQFQFGPLTSPGTELLVMPDELVGSDVDGTLAPDFLSQFDVEFDPAHDKLNLFEPSVCSGSPVYWSKSSDVIPIVTDRANHIFAAAVLDGKELRVELDTGTTLTLMSMVVTKAVFGLTETDPAMARDYNKAGVFKGYSYPFKQMKLGGVTLNDPPVKLSLFPYRQGPQMLIGMTTLGKLRLYLSYKQNKIYATPADAN